MSGIVPKSSKLLFGYVSPEFINLYSDTNKILVNDDICYFMFTNLLDIHRPMIGVGIVRDGYYTNDMNKSYYIELVGVYEEKSVLDRFFDNMSFETFSASAENKRSKICNFKIGYLNIEKDNFFSKNLLKIESFFCRLDIKELYELRKSYVDVIYNDLLKQAQEIKQVTESNLLTPTKFSDFNNL